jgi:predicted phosphodiesterase
MRYAIISDIHSNFEALQAVWDKLQIIGYDQIICLGDVVGYGPSPVECIEFLQQHNIITVKGNHDEYTAAVDSDPSCWEMQDYATQSIIWTKQQLQAKHLNWLRQLPYTIKHDSIQFVHASMETMEGEYWPYVLDKKNAEFHFYLQESNVAFFGHTHIPLFFSSGRGKITMEMLKTKKLPLNFTKFFINPGAVGQPRDADRRAAILTYDAAMRKITPVRVEYDIEKTCKKINKSGLPSILAARLSRGY